MHVRSRPLLVALATALCAIGLTAAAAQAASIAVVRGGDVWLVTPDNARERRVTTTGNFNSVTQADNGTLAAVDSSGAIHRMNQQGTELNAPFKFDRTPLDPDLSPDGSKIAFWYGAGSEARVGVTESNRATASSTYDTQQGWHISWYSNERMIYSNGAGYINVKGLGTGRWSNWFSNPDGRKFSSAITRSLDRVVVVTRNWDEVGNDFGPYQMVWYSTNGGPPSPDAAYGSEGPEPTARCIVSFGSVEPQRLSFSPDGSQLAWEQPDGVYVAPALDLASCTQPAGGFRIANARTPDFGPADVPSTIDPTPCCTPTPDEFSFKATVPNRRLLRALKRGLKVKISCSTACNVKRGRLKHKGRVVAKGSKSFPSGAGTLVMRFNSRAALRLVVLRRVKLAVRLTVTNPQGDVYLGRGSVTLRR